MGSIDLHTHSTVSDGTYTPAALAQLARERGVRTFSLTDHDNVTGLDEAERAAQLKAELLKDKALPQVIRRSFER